MTAILGFCDVCNAPVTDSNLAGYDEDGRVCCTNSHKKLPRAGRVILSGITIATQAARIAELEAALEAARRGGWEDAVAGAEATAAVLPTLAQRNGAQKVIDALRTLRPRAALAGSGDQGGG